MSVGGTHFVLASGSPRRERLLAAAGFEFEVVVPQVEEISASGLTLGETTLCNALRKGRTAARTHPEAVILAADTLVALEHEVIGKPADRADAFEILSRLNNREHTVATGIFLGHWASGRAEAFAVFSRVIFKKWNREKIEDYLEKINTLDKAGAYAAQGRGGEIIQRIIGSRSNVIGLPLEKVRPALARFGVSSPNESPPLRVPRPNAARVYPGAGHDKETRR